MREPDGVRHKALVVAYGVHESGRLEVVGIDVGEADPLVATKLLGEVRNVRRHASAAAFAAHAGVALAPASSGNRHRHCLALGGNRQRNRALCTIALVQACWDPAGQAYLARKRCEGRTGREALRCPKRQLANVVCRAMLKDVIARETVVATAA